MFKFYAFQLWEWLVVHGIPLAALVIIAILIPRVGRLAIRIVSGRFDEGEEATKSRLALVGALVYVLQAIAYFAIIMLGLTNLGVPAMGAALPATVVSAAIGFGAQNVIGDFLAGFFIISERQFGVGDFVSFDGTSSNISGTVVGLTLRATKVRTASGEVVTIPNGSAGVITNFSQDWSRAVVDLAVPLQAGESMSQLTDRVEATAAKALCDPSISSDVTGELEVLPATDIVAPTAAGQSWQVNFRVMVVVNPARQWAVERVLRSALVNDFWDRYEMPRVFLDGSDADTTTSPAPNPIKAIAAESALAPTEVMPAQRSGARTAPTGHSSAARTASAATDAIKAERPGVTPLNSDGTLSRAEPNSTAHDSTEASALAAPASHTERSEPGTHPDAITVDGTSAPEQFDAPSSAGAAGTAGTAGTASSASSAGSTGTAGAAGTASSAGTASTAGTVRTAGATGTADSDAEGKAADESEEFRGIWRNTHYSSKFKRIMSVGGRTRPSTTGLILALLVVGGLALASSNPEGGGTGWLSPDYWRDRPAKSETTHDPKDGENTSEGTAENTSDTPTDSSTGDSTDNSADTPTGNASESTSDNSSRQSTDGASNPADTDSETNTGGQSDASGGAESNPANEPRAAGASGVSGASDANAQNDGRMRAMGAPNATDTTHG